MSPLESIKGIDQNCYLEITTTYRYQDVEQSAFTARLTVDNDGLIINYEHLFKKL